MAGSAEGIRKEISSFKLSSLDGSTQSVPYGCLLNAVEMSSGISNARKLLEEHLQRPLDHSKFNACCQPILKRHRRMKQSPKSVTQWDDFRRYLHTLWPVIVPRAPEDIKRRPAPLSSAEPSPSSSATPTANKKLRSDCDRCPVMEARLESLKLQHAKEIQLLEEERDQLKRDYFQAVWDRNDAQEEKWKYMGYFHKRVNTVKKLRASNNSRKARLDRFEKSDISSANRKLINCKISRKFKINDIASRDRQIEDLESTVNSLRKELRGLELYVDDLECSREVRRDVVITEEKLPRVYHWKFRKVVYMSLHAKVPYRYVADLVQGAVLELAGVKVGHLPSKSTISRMIYEVSVLCLLQATEALLRSPQATICWDATSIEDQHINEIHVETVQDTKKESFTLSMCVLPGGKAVDYVTHMTDVIDKMVLVYSEYHGLEALNVKNDIISRIGSTLSDRAAVNHAAVRDLRNLWSKHLVELHCNLHPMDSFSSGTCKLLKPMDQALGMPTTGREDCISNMLYALTRLGRKQSSGEPSTFHTHLLQHGIAVTEFPRYVGSRWNLLFQMALTLLQHFRVLKDYIKDILAKDAMRTDLIWAFGEDDFEPRIGGQLKALALIGIVLTTPYMALFYGNKDESSNLEMVPHIKAFSAQLDTFCRNPDLLRTTKTDVFGNPLKSHPLLEQLQKTPMVGTFQQTLDASLSAIQTVTGNQLERYISGELSEVTEDMLYKTQASSPHNVWAERVLGMYNAVHDRTKTAKPTYIETKCTMATNKFLEWLNAKEDTEQQKLIEFAVKMSSSLRKKEKEREKWLEKEANLRLVAKKQVKVMKNKREFTKKVAAVLREGDVEGLNVFEEFQNLEEDDKRKVRDMASKIKMNGLEFCHKFAEDDGEVITWHGKITGQHTRAATGLETYKILYWLPEFEEETRDDDTYNMFVEDLLCDLFTQDLWFR